MVDISFVSLIHLNQRINSSKLRQHSGGGAWSLRYEEQDGYPCNEGRRHWDLLVLQHMTDSVCAFCVRYHDEEMKRARKRRGFAGMRTRRDNMRPSRTDCEVMCGGDDLQSTSEA